MSGSQTFVSIFWVCRKQTVVSRRWSNSVSIVVGVLVVVVVVFLVVVLLLVVMVVKWWWWW